VTVGATAARLRVVLRWVLLPVLVAIVIVQTLTSVRTGAHFGVVLGDGGVAIQDFASHVSFVKAFWRGEGGFGVADHLRVTERLAGQPLPYALPFGYAPTMLWLLGPLSPLPTAWAFVVWTLLGLAAALWMFGRQRSLAVASVFITPVAMGCWGLGQTAVLSTVALFALARWDGGAAAAQERPLERRELILAAMVVWALTAKPPLAVAAATALCAGRRFAVVAVAAGLAIATTVVLLPLIGKSGLVDYLTMLRHYDLDTAPAAYAWSLKPATMGNLRALLHVTFGVGDAVASRWSALAWVLASAAVAVAGVHRKLEVRWALAVLAFLLFCPHVSWTEELALVFVLAACADAPVSPGTLAGFRTSRDELRPAKLAFAHANWARAAAMAFVLVMVFLLPGIPFQGGVRLPVAFAGKLVLAGWLWAAGAASTVNARSA
jgi:hypothetical protein